MVVVQIIGISRLFRHYSRPPPPPVSPSLRRDEVPHLTILRPVKGLDTQLYECLASTLRQAYPRDKLTVCYCIDSAEDPAYPILQRLLCDFSNVDARIFIESEDPLLHGPNGHVKNLGPNPKIRNLSRAYREAKGDIVWVIDANVWVGSNVGGRMVDKLCGYLPDGHRTTPYKFVHQLPLVVDTVIPQVCLLPQGHVSAEDTSARNGSAGDTSARDASDRVLGGLWETGGSRLDEMFMATTHAKFYSAINAVGIAPCIVGKSNMWRKSHLLQLTDPSRNPKIAPCPQELTGLDYFSRYICEDHMVGDLLFKCPIPGFKHHGLVAGDIAIQPVWGMSVKAYIARRVRWLRARKWTVLVATLVEPGVESLLCNFYLAFALTTIPYMRHLTGIPSTWSALGLAWFCGVAFWMAIDWVVFAKLHRGDGTEVDRHTPTFAQGSKRPCGIKKRRFGEWLVAWLGRELLALPIWTWAVLLGTTVSWRGKRFAIRPDMSVVALSTSREVEPPAQHQKDIIQPWRGDSRRTRTPEVEGGIRSKSKDGV